MTPPDPVDFFERQFQRQVRAADFALNPFEQLALPHVGGSVLDLGCGLGNLSLEAARRGCRVSAVDASPTAVERLRAAALREQLRLDRARGPSRQFPAPGGTRKEFATLIAQKPATPA